MDDRLIIDLFFDRDERALQETDAKYGRLLKTLSLNVTGDEEDAKEIVNDAYLAAWNSIPPQSPVSLIAYLSRITRNLSCKLLEKKTAFKRSASVTELTEELCACIPDAETPEETYEQKELSRLIDRFVSGLGREEQYLFMQRYYWSRSVKELSEELEMSESKVKSKLFRIRKKLYKELTEAEIL